jgi:hypothetical protein
MQNWNKDGFKRINNGVSIIVLLEITCKTKVEGPRGQGGTGIPERPTGVRICRENPCALKGP